MAVTVMVVLATLGGSAAPASRVKRARPSRNGGEKNPRARLKEDDITSAASCVVPRGQILTWWLIGAMETQ